MNLPKHKKKIIYNYLIKKKKKKKNTQFLFKNLTEKKLKIFMRKFIFKIFCFKMDYQHTQLLSL